MQLSLTVVFFLNRLKSELRFFWFGVVLRESSGGPPGLCGFSPMVDLRMVFLCLVLGSCGVSGFSVVFWSLFLVNFCTLCLFLALCGVSSFVTKLAPVTCVCPIFGDGV